MARRQRTSARARRGQAKESLDEKFVEATGADAGAPEPPQIDERQTFGNTLATWMVVEIAPDGLQAALKRMTFGGDDTLTAAEVTEALRDQYHIAHGLDETLVQELTARCLAKPSGTVTGNHVVARGDRPVPGEPGRLEYTFRQRLAADAQPALGELQAAFAQGDLEQVIADDLLGLMVQPGEELARRVAATQGEAGRDIFGNISLEPGEDPPLEAGANVRESGDRYIAEVYGYVCLVDSQLSVIPPVWVDAAQMRAYFVHFPQAAAAPAPREAWLTDALAALGVSHGVDEQAIGALVGDPPDATVKKTVPIARGTPPVPGADTRVDYPFDPQKRAGKIMPDGSIDLRERNAVIGVEAGQSLGQVIAATQGVPGTDLRGGEVPTSDGREIAFKAGENVRAEGDPPRAFFAGITGNVHLAGDTIHVKEVFVVGGDVDYDTGNIDTPNDVQINGNVGAGFAVKSGGSISVGGLVESGATLTARGDITVAQGIVGEGTKVAAQGVISLGCVQTKFIQNATVMAKSDIEVGSYIFNSQVRSGGNVIVRDEGGDRGGSIVGGETFASKTVRCRTVGSPSASGTTIGISPDPEKSARMKKLDKAVAFCETNILRLLRTMGLQTIDAQRIKAVVRQTPQPKQKVMVEIVKKLYALVDTRDNSTAERAGLEEQLDRALDKGEVAVAGSLYAGVAVEMGNSAFTAKDDAAAVTLYRTPDGIRTRPFSG